MTSKEILETQRVYLSISLLLFAPRTPLAAEPLCTCPKSCRSHCCSQRVRDRSRKSSGKRLRTGAPKGVVLIAGSFLLTVGASLLAVELLCLQSVEVLMRGRFPL